MANMIRAHFLAKRASSGLLARLYSTGNFRVCAADAVRDEEGTLKRVLGSALSDIRSAGTWKEEFEIVTPQGPSIGMCSVQVKPAYQIHSLTGLML